MLLVRKTTYSFELNLKTERLTWVTTDSDSTSTKVATTRDWILLVVTVKCKRRMCYQRVWIITLSSFLDF